jgi:hypothetical protein
MDKNFTLKLDITRDDDNEKDAHIFSIVKENRRKSSFIFSYEDKISLSK